MTVRKEKQIGSGGLESTLAGLAALWLVFGICSVLIAFTLTLTVNFLMAIIQLVSSLFTTIVVWLIIRALAELIRLGKLQNGLPYSGKISSSNAVTVYNCGKCGAAVHTNVDQCYACGAKFETDPKVDDAE